MLPQNKIVVKDNSLIDASFNLTLVEQRIMLLAIVSAREINNLSPETPIEIKVKDYVQQYSVTNATAYETIKDAADILFNRQFSFNSRYKDTNAITKARWVNKITYVKDIGEIVLHLSSDVISLISRLESQFTKYMLDQVSGFKSKYSIRLYELVLKWSNTGKTEKYEIDDLRNKLGVSESEYKQFSDFKKRVLEVAINEISDQTDIKLEMTLIKAGRTVTHIQFRIIPKQVKDVTPKQLNYKMSQSQIEMFGDLLCRNSEFQSYFVAERGEEMSAYIARVKKMLEKEFYVESWYPYLLKVGFKAKLKK